MARFWLSRAGALERRTRRRLQPELVVHRIHTRTSKTRRDEWYPASHLGKRADFRKIKDQPGISRALYPIPGKLLVKPRTDGELMVTVDLSISGHGRSERKSVRFCMDPSQKRADEFIFVPTEIVNNIGKSMDEWEDPSWD